jgi:hypothetical protein
VEANDCWRPFPADLEQGTRWIADIAPSRMTVVRASLLAALRRVADGGGITEAELDIAVPDRSRLILRRRTPWEELSHWADDDIRARDERYASWKPERMRIHIASDG